MASQETDQSELTTEFATAKGLTAGATAVAQPENPSKNSQLRQYLLPNYQNRSIPRASGTTQTGLPTSLAVTTTRRHPLPPPVKGSIGATEADFFVIRIVSENTQSVTGIEPDALFQQRCFTDFLTPPEKTEFIIRARAFYADTSRSDPDVFSISLSPLDGASRRLFCAMHLNKESDLIVCEFELDRDFILPEQMPNSGFPPEPIQIIHNEATDDELLLPRTRRSKPLHSLQIARSSARQLTLVDSFQILLEIQAQLSSAPDLKVLGDAIVGLVHDLTGFHRVMIYQFDDTTAGAVVGEYVDPRASKDLYRGLHFPAADIPKQARELYMINTIRMLYNREEPTARLICRTFDDSKTPLNLQHSYLRAMSPIHLKYLANMGVQASMSISLIADNKLWGLISCHNYGPASGIHVSLATREICRGLGNVASSNIQKLIYSSRIEARRPLSNAPPKSSPFTYITSSTTDLLNMFGADFGFLVIKGEARTIGNLFSNSEAIVLLQYIRQRAQPLIYYSHAIGKDLPDLHYAPGFSMISYSFVVAGTDYLEPRSSFKRWSETVVGTSREWTVDEVESAAVLTTLYGRFIEVWRQKEATVQRNRMTRLLIRNARHEVRTPLNSIINYLKVALEEELDERARFHLQRSLQASKSLLFVVNDLLHLTEAEGADFQVHEDNVDLRSMLSEVIATFKDESVRRDLRIKLEDDKAVPQLVRCDPGALRQVASNLLSNSLQSTVNGEISIGLEHVQTTEANSVIKISFTDNGIGLSESQLDGIFKDFEQILDEEGEEKTQTGEQILPEKKMGPQIGLGLATVARFVRLQTGQISMSSEGQGKGTNVSITIPFRKALSGDFSRKQFSEDIALPTPTSGPQSSKTPKTSGSASSSLTQASVIDTATSPVSPGTATDRYPFPISPVNNDRPKFNVLVAEDNPLNSRLLETRLKRRGHSVRIAVDGKACVDAFKSSPHEFDFILMDIQLSPRVVPYARIPIIAVSASLSEQRVHEYVEIGFDGWILKPIDFKRLEAILIAVEDEKTREILLYGAGNWEKGGWFKVKSEV
ncbi:uncharacterized protein LY89DRAFT_789271 [Mollisia scopiformis]|uniref:Phytochrome n=1 Tax=Mollisia scopiformis TaxID=149040 RepID=A0A132B6I6_MOLSC|nr:uncharacterized protein LY89DRAFT_789271 [Mollisia scopiformis]KUJ08015.1 hypothetical protein LY89DRAFT_789271 [Mollisia scopiformis]